MTMAVTDPMAIIGFVVFDRDGEEVGEVEGVFMGPEEPDWAVLLLPTGRYVLVPLADADIYEDSLDLPFTAAQVHGAPLQQRALPEDLTQSQRRSSSPPTSPAVPDRCPRRRRRPRNRAARSPPPPSTSPNRRPPPPSSRANGWPPPGRRQRARRRRPRLRPLRRRPDPGIAGVLSDVQTFARRRPGAFLLGAAAVGVVAGRAVRAAKAEDPETTKPPVLPRRTGTTRGGR